MSLIAAAVVNVTCPDVKDGYRDECGNVDDLVCGFGLDFPAVGGGESSMVSG
jgi:hypothetical protein